MKINKTAHYVMIKTEDKTYTLAVDTYYALKIDEHAPLDVKLIPKLEHESLQYEAKEKALKALKKPKTTFEIKTLLSSYNQKIVEDVLIFLKQYRYIDDTLYMKWFVEFKVLNGKKFFIQTFKEKGIQFEHIDAYLKSFDDHTRILNASTKLIHTLKGMSVKQKKQKIYQKLYALGFETSDIVFITNTLDIPKEDEKKLLDALFNKKYSKLKGSPYEKCQSFIKFALSKGFDFSDAKLKCEDIE